MGIVGTPYGPITNFSNALGSAVLTYIGSNSTIVSTDTTFNAGNFTVANDGLLIVMAFGAVTGASTGYTSVTVGGNAATIWFTNPSGGHRYGVCSIVVTAGTYNVTQVTDATSIRAQVAAVWLLQNYNQTSPTSINWADAVSTTEPCPYDTTVGGVFVGVSLINVATALAWSSATERYDVNLEDTERFGAADIATPFTTSSQPTETVTWTGASVTSTHCVAVFV